MVVEGFLLCMVILFVIIGVFTVAILRAVRMSEKIQAQAKRIQAEENALVLLEQWQSKGQISTPGERDKGWQPCMVAVTPTHVILYERSVKAEELFRFRHDQLRWFGRPEKYTSGQNEIWLHVEAEDQWRIARVEFSQVYMRDLVRALKTVVAPELVTAYRRRRPYIHIEPREAHPATQDIHGAWTLSEPVQLYVMPRFVVIFQGKDILRKIALEGVQRIGGLKRIDQPGADGLVRFQAEEETFAFALKDHERFAEQLAEAAKRTLEAPLEQKQKGKDDEYEWDE